MATLQNIRSKGPLLVIVIGVALFAFIAGDAWKVLQPHQSQDVAEVNGKTLSAQEYQALVEEYTEVVKLSSGMNSLTDEQNDQIKDEVWRTYVNNQLLQEEAGELGLTVSDAELQYIIQEGKHPLLQQTPFRNPQTGAFDKDILMKFLADYAKLDKNQVPEYYQSMYTYWRFIEKNLVASRLAEKYQNLISKSMISNSVEAQATFDARVNEKDLLVAAFPYSSVADTLVTVTDSELKARYNEKKEQFEQKIETRDIQYVDFQVKASATDRQDLFNEVSEYATQLSSQTADYTTFIRSTGSEVAYTDLFLNKSAFPSDVVARMDTAKLGKVYGPYYNSDNTFNVFKVIAKAKEPNAVEYQQIQIVDETDGSAKSLADSIYTALKGGADFQALAKKYNQSGETQKLLASEYERTAVSSDGQKVISTLNEMSVNQVKVLNLGRVAMIFKVTDRNDITEKFKVAVVKRTIDFSKDTYNKAYNNFSQFVAANPTLDKLVANAEDAGYRLLSRNDLSSSEHTVGSVKGTKEALRWIFSAEVGDVSGLYECGESDHLMVVAVAGVNEAGYRSFDKVKPMLKAELLKEKKAAKIMSDLKASKAVSMSEFQAFPIAVNDSVKRVNFAAPAYVSVLRSSEPMVNAYASVAKEGELSTPIQGNAGVMVLQSYSVKSSNQKFDLESELKIIEGTHGRMASYIVNDLNMKSEIVDNRYLFF